MKLRELAAAALDRLTEALGEEDDRTVAVYVTDGWVDLRGLPDAFKARLGLGGGAGTLYFHRPEKGPIQVKTHTDLGIRVEEKP